MSKSTDLTAKIRFIFEVDATQGIGQLGQAADGVKVLKFNIGEITQVTTNVKEATSGYGSTVRGLLLNLRMFSFAVRTLRRELGDTNPVIESISSSLLVVAATLTGLVAGLDLASKAAKVFAGTSLPALIGALKVTIGVLGGIGTVATIVGSILLVTLAKGVFDVTSGISALRQEARAMADDLLMLKTTLEALNLEQDRFNIGLSATSITMMKLKRAIDLQQSGTEALEAELAAVTAEYRNMQIASAEANQEMALGNLIAKETQEALADIERSKAAIQMVRAARGFITEEEARRSLEMVGYAKPGDVRPSRRVIAAAREQTRAGINPPGAAGTNVNINFPNALFQTVEGVREAIIEGARQAADIIRFNQYAEPGTQR